MFFISHLCRVGVLAPLGIAMQLPPPMVHAAGQRLIRARRERNITTTKFFYYYYYIQIYHLTITCAAWRTCLTP